MRPQDPHPDEPGEERRPRRASTAAWTSIAPGPTEASNSSAPAARPAEQHRDAEAEQRGDEEGQHDEGDRPSDRLRQRDARRRPRRAGQRVPRSRLPTARMTAAARPILSRSPVRNGTKPDAEARAPGRRPAARAGPRRRRGSRPCPPRRPSSVRSEPRASGPRACPRGRGRGGTRAGSRRSGRAAARRRPPPPAKTGSPSMPMREVEHQRGGARPRAEQAADDEDGERLQRHRHRARRQRHHDLRGERRRGAPAGHAQPRAGDGRAEVGGRRRAMRSFGIRALHAEGHGVAAAEAEGGETGRRRPGPAARTAAW